MTSDLRDQFLPLPRFDFLSDPAQNMPILAGLQEVPAFPRLSQQGYGFEQYQSWTSDASVPLEQLMVGEVYSDGSCFKSGHKVHHRSGWALVKLSPTGECLAKVWGPVGALLPQTSPAGEYTAVLAAVSLFPGITSIVTDYQGVVDLPQLPGEVALHRKSFYAGLKLLIRGHAHPELTIRKCPAHVDSETLPRFSPE